MAEAAKATSVAPMILNIPFLISNLLNRLLEGIEKTLWLGPTRHNR